jgi:serine-type D-Ala-D-Ala carboxypeptidase
MNAPVLRSAQPQQVGMSSQQLDRAAAYVERAVNEGILPLADVLVARGGTIVLHQSFVNSEVTRAGHELRDDSLYYLASFTKPLLATLIMQQVERGSISLVRPVAEYIPEFGQRGKEQVTVRHLLCHASGLPDDWPGPGEFPASLEGFVEIISRQPLIFEPGTRCSYCTWGFAVLAEILHRAIGEEIEPLARRILLDPLSMTHTHLAWDERWTGRIIPVFDSDLRVCNPWQDLGLRSERLFRGDTGAYSTTRDVAALCQMMLNGGSYGGKRILSPLCVRRMTEPQYAWWDTPERLSAGPVEQFATLSKGLGWQPRGDNHFRGSDLMSSRAFFHGGHMGMRAIVDPEYDLITVFMTSIVATRPGQSAYFGQAGQVCHTFGTMAFAAVAEL